MTRRSSFATFVAFLLLAAAGQSVASIITVNAADFPGVGGGTYTSNIVVDGLRFSPSCHYDLPDGYGTPFIGIDESGCDSRNNPNYLGDVTTGFPPRLYIDAGGQLFTLKSLTWHANISRLISSNGGLFSGSGPTFQFITDTFTGPEWTGIRSLVWTFPAAPGAPCCGIASIMVEISEPESLLLIVSGIVVIPAFLRRQRSDRGLLRLQ